MVAESPGEITANILVDEVKRQQAHGIVRGTAHQPAPLGHACRLTERGAAADPAGQAPTGER